MASRRLRDVLCGVTHKLKFCGDGSECRSSSRHSALIPFMYCSNRSHKHKAAKNIYLNTRWILLWFWGKGGWWRFVIARSLPEVSGNKTVTARLNQCCQYSDKQGWRFYTLPEFIESENYWTQYIVQIDCKIRFLSRFM